MILLQDKLGKQEILLGRPVKHPRQDKALRHHHKKEPPLAKKATFLIGLVIGGRRAEFLVAVSILTRLSYTALDLRVVGAIHLHPSDFGERAWQPVRFANPRPEP
jgi:hypothetical protein